MLNVEGMYDYEPNEAERRLALQLQRLLTPTPKIRFVAVPWAGGMWFEQYLQIENPNTGVAEQYDSAMTLRNPTVTINDLTSSADGTDNGFKFVPPPPAKAAAPVEVYTGMPPLKPGQVNTP